MITIYARLNGHELSLLTTPMLASDSDRHDQVNFVFDEYWDGFTKTALFWGGDSETPYASILDLNNNAVIPAEVLADKATIRFGVFGIGTDGETVITSTIVKYKVQEGAWSSEFFPESDITPSYAQQLLAAANAAIQAAEDCIDQLPAIGSRIDDLDTRTTTAEGYITSLRGRMGAAETGITNVAGMVHGVVNIANMVNGTLTSDNIVSAIQAALAKSRYIFIPAGSYAFDMEISTDCTIYLSPNTVLSPTNGNSVFYVHDCTFSLYGGSVVAGIDDYDPVTHIPLSRASAYSSFPNRRSETMGIIFLKNCVNSVISGLRSGYSKYYAVIQLRDCTNTIIENLSTMNSLNSVIFIVGRCINTTVRNCVMRYARYGLKANGDPRYYCYFVYTGHYDMYYKGSDGNGWQPPDGLIYENNYCYDSEDSGLDTHGATNVIIRNNVVNQTVCAITAYSDSHRQYYIAGWTMNNVLIENNKCVSNKTNNPETEWTHPFVLLGSANLNVADTENSRKGSYNDFKNAIIRNNYFDSGTTYDDIIHLNFISSNVEIVNNFIKARNASTRAIGAYRSINLRIINNDIVATRNLLFYNSSVEIRGNTMAPYDYNPAYLCHIFGETLKSKPGVVSGNCYAAGDVVWTENGLKFCKNYGLRVVSTAYTYFNNPILVNVINGRATVVGGSMHGLIPGLALTMYSGIPAGNDYVYGYVRTLDALDSFLVMDSNKQAIDDGDYTCYLREALFDEYVVQTT